MNDEALQRRYQEGMRQLGTPGDGAPDPDLIRRVARGEATEAERLRVLDIVMQSEGLRREYDTFRALAAAERLGRSRWPRLLAAAALLVVVGGTLMWRDAPPPEEAWRGGGDVAATISPAPNAAVTTPVRMVWLTTPGAHAYDVEILREDGTVLARYTSTDTTASVSDTAGFVPGARYGWAVTARLKNGGSARSSLSWFTIQP